LKISNRSSEAVISFVLDKYTDLDLSSASSPNEQSAEYKYCSSRTYYPDSEPTSPCSFSWMVRATRRINKVSTLILKPPTKKHTILTWGILRFGVLYLRYRLILIVGLLSNRSMFFLHLLTLECLICLRVEYYEEYNLVDYD
jgi:hypothetical protein